MLPTLTQLIFSQTRRVTPEVKASSRNVVGVSSAVESPTDQTPPVAPLGGEQAAFGRAGMTARALHRARTVLETSAGGGRGVASPESASADPQSKLQSLTMGKAPRDPENATIFIDDATLPPVDRPIERKRVDHSKTEVIDVLELSEVRRGALAVELNRITAEVFAGPSLLGIGQFTNDKDAQQIGVEIYRNRAGEPVGYHICKVNLVDVEGQGKVAVMRSRAAIKAEYRGGNNISLFALKQAIRYKLTRVFTDLRYFTLVIHPSSYAVMGRDVPGLLQPSPDRPLDDETRAIMAAIAKAKDYQLVDEERPMVMRASYGTTTRQSNRQADELRNSENRFVRYFIDQTNMAEGVGLAVTVPCNFTDIVPYVFERAVSSVLSSFLGARKS